jgi:hypothetical protein
MLHLRSGFYHACSPVRKWQPEFLRRCRPVYFTCVSHGDPARRWASADYRWCDCRFVGATDYSVYVGHAPSKRRTLQCLDYDLYQQQFEYDHRSLMAYGNIAGQRKRACGWGRRRQRQRTLDCRAIPLAHRRDSWGSFRNLFRSFSPNRSCNCRDFLRCSGMVQKARRRFSECNPGHCRGARYVRCLVFKLERPRNRSKKIDVLVSDQFIDLVQDFGCFNTIMCNKMWRVNDARKRGALTSRCCLEVLQIHRTVLPPYRNC